MPGYLHVKFQPLKRHLDCTLDTGRFFKSVGGRRCTRGEFGVFYGEAGVTHGS